MCQVLDGPEFPKKSYQCVYLDFQSQILSETAALISSIKVLIKVFRPVQEHSIKKSLILIPGSKS